MKTNLPRDNTKNYDDKKLKITDLGHKSEIGLSVNKNKYKLELLTRVEKMRK